MYRAAVTVIRPQTRWEREANYIQLLLIDQTGGERRQRDLLTARRPSSRASATTQNEEQLLGELVTLMAVIDMFQKMSLSFFSFTGVPILWQSSFVLVFLVLSDLHLPDLPLLPLFYFTTLYPHSFLPFLPSLTPP